MGKNSRLTTRMERPMSFRDDPQIAAVCMALCASVGLREAWTLSGPSDLAIAVAEGRPHPLSSGEELVIRIAMDVWNGQGGATLARLLGALDPDRTKMIAELLVACVTSYAAVDAWLAKYGDARAKN
jgi:hypothetical protein